MSKPKNLHDIIAAWRSATGDLEAKLRVAEDFRGFVAGRATTGDVFELLKAIDLKGYVSTRETSEEGTDAESTYLKRFDIRREHISSAIAPNKPARDAKCVHGHTSDGKLIAAGWLMPQISDVHPKQRRIEAKLAHLRNRQH